MKDKIIFVRQKVRSCILILCCNHNFWCFQSLHFMKKIPPGAEAANILVGEVDFLNHPVVGFVRLLHPIILRDLTEVPVPTKFVFILLGPMGNQSKYHEIGRSIATLMSDEVRFLSLL